MKRCLKCNTEYLDDSLEFCLEDGTRLAAFVRSPENLRTPIVADSARAALPLTVSMPVLPDAPETETRVRNIENAPKTTGANPAAAIGYAAVIIALAHNWWQWIYLEKQYMYSIPEYLLSANFLMWLLLLASGSVLSIFAVRKRETKVFGIIGLVVLAVNLILYLVPRK